ncbi:MAG: ABC transporter ATP-binding protein [Candidatus Kaiserbacteria bacterium]|nr:ABC transporter ATP-binding protein [Candidatus Kaiserbacteria bacterium]
MEKKDQKKPALAVQNLTKHFSGVLAIDNLSLSITQGAITSIVGPNGSGKTTLINTLSGIFKPEQGTITVQGRTVPPLHPHDVWHHGITRTFQNTRLFEQMTVLDNVLVVLTKRSVIPSLLETKDDTHYDQAKQVLAATNLWEKRDQLAANLSYGQRKLLEIARSLATDADIYLFDEPFAGLFPKMVTVVFTILRSLKQEGKTVVLVEHDMDLIRKISDHVIVLDSGTLLAQGSPEQVLSEKSVVEAYLGQ